MAYEQPETWWRRVGSSTRGFHYVRPDGAVRAPAALRRIRALRVPPGWTDVHIAPDPRRELQAWGRDRAGRKQYIYSAARVAKRDGRKWSSVLRVGRLLPTLRAATNAHLCRPELDREKVLATVVRLMSRGFFRVGGERYAIQNRTFGICTLAKRHVRVEGPNLVFRYRGKRRKEQRQIVADTPLARIVDELLDLPGKRLFRYRNGNGTVSNLTARLVNTYLLAVLGGRCTSKDLRTFGGTVRAATILAELGPPVSEREAKKHLSLCCRLVAQDLGNTPAICRKAYIHPAVLGGYEHGRTIEAVMRKAPRPLEAREPPGFYPEEAALMRFLERYG
ncbi:MAG: DNA topoisomerase IB [Gemmatimonadetes bacterium]|nr:DNA topoisomerase IB [Gemmatimonadota bacterium]